MIEKVKIAIIENKLIEKGDRVVVGVSGGPDSICLLHALMQLRNELGFEIFCVHVNHMIRGMEADLDEDYVKDFCKEHGIPFSVYRYDIPNIAKAEKLSSEEAARIYRYEAFEKEKCKQICNKIAIAHNKNDQVETLLMRLMRGTSPSGLACMEPMRENCFIRPLLGITRTEIETYCFENELNPRIDKSNMEPIYTRNKIRLELIPYLEKDYNENLTDSLFRLSKIAAEDKSYFNMVVENFINNHVKISNAESSKLANTGSQKLSNSKPQNPSYIGAKAEFSIKAFNLEHPTIRKKILLKLAEIISKAEDISYINLESGIKFLETGKTSKVIEFPNDLIIGISYDVATIKLKPSRHKIICDEKKMEDEFVEAAYEIAKVGKLIEKVISINEIKDFKEKENIKYFDYDSVSKENLKLVLRKRRSGDYIKPLGMAGTKSIKELFIDEKVPKEEREKILLVCLGSKVLWIIGSRINEDYKITNCTKQVLMLEYIKQV